MRFDATIAESDGVTVKERLEADDEQALHDMLGREGRMLVRAKALDAATNDISVRRTKMSQRRLLLLTQALHEALDAGVPLLGTFQAISQQEADPNIALMLEDLGYCAKGEGHEFVRNGHIAHGGGLPVNTNGGGLSCVHPGMYGMFVLNEAIRQARGDAPGVQIEDANLCLAHGNGGVLSSEVTTIWGTEQTL